MKATIECDVPEFDPFRPRVYVHNRATKVVIEQGGTTVEVVVHPGTPELGGERGWVKISKQQGKFAKTIPIPYEDAIGRVGDPPHPTANKCPKCGREYFMGLYEHWSAYHDGPMPTGTEEPICDCHSIIGDSKLCPIHTMEDYERAVKAAEEHHALLSDPRASQYWDGPKCKCGFGLDGPVCEKCGRTAPDEESECHYHGGPHVFAHIGEGHLICKCGVGKYVPPEKEPEKEGE